MGDIEKLLYTFLGSWLLSIIIQQKQFSAALQPISDLPNKQKKQRLAERKEARRALGLHFFLFMPTLVAFALLILPLIQAFWFTNKTLAPSWLQNTLAYPGITHSLYFLLGAICSALPVEILKGFARRYVLKTLNHTLKKIEENDDLSVLGDGEDRVDTSAESERKEKQRATDR